MSDLVNLAIADITQTIREKLTPFIQKIESTDRQYQVLVDIMRNMPEFQCVIKENELLKSQIKNNTPMPEPSIVQELINIGSNPVILEIKQITTENICKINTLEYIEEIYASCNISNETIEEEESSESETEEEETRANEIEAKCLIKIIIFGYFN